MPDGNSERRQFCFGEFVLDVDRAALSRAGADIRLRPQSFEVLRHLVERSGRLVSRDELMDTVWAGRVVTDGALTQCIVDIRRALDDGGQQFVRTVARRGFVFEAAVECASAGRSAPSRGVRAHTPAAPLANSKPAITAAGIALLVVSMAWLMQDVLRDRAGREAPGSQPQAVAPAAANASRSAEAHGLYLSGRHLFHRRQPGDLEAAEQHLRQALALDPTHAHAWTTLAGVFHVRGVELGDPGYRLVEQAEALRRALQIEPNLGEAHVRLARFAGSVGDPAARRALMARAMQFAPDDPLVIAARTNDAFRSGRIDEAVALSQRLVEIDPLSVVYRNNLGIFLLAGGRYDDALRELRSAEDLSPANRLTKRTIAHTLLLLGRRDEALQASLAVVEGPDRDQLRVLLDEGPVGAEALHRLHRDTSAHGLVRLAELAAHRGDLSEARDRLDAAVDQLRATAVNDHRANETRTAVLISPYLRQLRDDPHWGRW